MLKLAYKSKPRAIKFYCLNPGSEKNRKIENFSLASCSVLRSPVDFMHYLSPFRLCWLLFGAWHIRLYNCWRARMRREPDVQIISWFCEDISGRARPATVNRIGGGEILSQNTSTRCRRAFFAVFSFKSPFSTVFHSSRWKVSLKVFSPHDWSLASSDESSI